MLYGSANGADDPDMEMEVFMGGSPFMGVAVRMDIEPKGCAIAIQPPAVRCQPTPQPTREGLNVPQIFDQDRQQCQQDNAEGMAQTPSQPRFNASWG